MCKRMLLIILVLIAVMAFTALSETDQKALKGLYKTDALGYSAGSIKPDGEGWQDCVFDADSWLGDGQHDIVPHFTFENGESIRLYKNGRMIVARGDGLALLRADDGSEVFSEASLSVTGFAKPGGWREMFADGLLMVYDMDESLTGVDYRFGILNTEGDWVLPLSGDHALLDCGLQIDSDLFTDERSMVYAGEGCFLITDREDYFYMRLYNSVEDAVYSPTLANEDKDMRGSLHRSNDMDTWGRFSNGRSEYGLLMGGNLLMMDAQGNIDWNLVFDKAWLPQASHVRYGGQWAEDGRYASLAYCKEHSWVVYSDASTIDLGAFRIVDQIPFDGFWMVSAQNSEGTAFWFALDTAGQFIFEPQRADAIELLLEDGRVLECTDHDLDQYGPKKLVTTDGRVLYECSDPHRTLGLNNGVVCEYIDNSVSSDEEMLFVDVRDLLAE